MIKHLLSAVRLVALAAALGVTGASARAAAEAQIGQVKTTAGEVKALRGKAEVTLAPGAALFQRDVIVTGPNSAVGMTFIDNSSLALGPGSRLSLERFTFSEPRGKAEFISKLDSGTLFAVSGKIAAARPEAMQVKTPTTILGVRGTQFVVRAGE